MKDLETQQKFIKLRAADQSLESIGKTIGVSKPTLIKWNKKFRLEINDIRSSSIEDLKEQYRLTKEARLQRLSVQLDKVTDELSLRDLKGMTTSALLHSFCKLTERVQDELDGKKVELGGKVTLSDPLARWEDIVSKCIVVEVKEEDGETR